MTAPKLTKRQSEVLHWIQQGANNKTIAKRIGVSESTVKLHVTAVLKKYGAKSRTQLAMSSTHGQQIIMMPLEVEQNAILWVKRNNDAVTAISLKPIDGWEALYAKK